VKAEVFALDLEHISDENDPLYQAYRRKLRLDDLAVSTSKLIRLGRERKAKGIARHTRPSIKLLGNHECHIHGPLELASDWSEYDFTHPLILNMSLEAKNSFLSRNAFNSCPFDAVIAGCVFIHLGLRRGDITTTANLRAMTKPQLAMYTIIRAGIEDMTLPPRNLLVQRFMRMVESVPRAEFTFGTMSDVNDWFNMIVPAFRSCTFTLVDGTVCCDNKFRFDPVNPSFMTHDVFNITLYAPGQPRLYPGQTLGDIVNLHWFKNKTWRESNLSRRGRPLPRKQKCTHGDACYQRPLKEPRLLTSLPGNFVYATRGGVPMDEPTMEERKLFDDIWLDQRNHPVGSPDNRYCVVFVVFYRPGHFFCRMRKHILNPDGKTYHTRYFEHDGTRSDVYIPVPGWTGKLEKSSKVVTLIYQKFDSSIKMKEKAQRVGRIPERLTSNRR
jgi:hypothetical protein